MNETMNKDMYLLTFSSSHLLALLLTFSPSHPHTLSPSHLLTLP